VAQLLDLMGKRLVLAGGLTQRFLEVVHALLEVGDGRVLVLLMDARGLLLVALAEEAGLGRRRQHHERREAAKDKISRSHLVTAFREYVRILSRNWGLRKRAPFEGAPFPSAKTAPSGIGAAGDGRHAAAVLRVAGLARVRADRTLLAVGDR